MLRRNITSCGILSLAVMLLLPAVVFAQSTVTAVTISNAYVGVTLYTGGENENGRFQIWNVLGDTSNTQDDNQEMVTWGQVEIMLDGLSDDAEDAAQTWLTYEKNSVLRYSAILGDEEHGTWIVPPYVVSGEPCIKGVYWPSIPSEGVAPNVAVEEEIRILHDTVRFKWTVYNEDYSTRQVGLRLNTDLITEPANSGTQNDDNAVSIPGYSLVRESSLFPYTKMPASVETYNSQSDPGRGVRQTLSGGQNAVTAPDMFGVDEYAIIFSNMWTYLPDVSSGALRATWGYELYPEHQGIVNNVATGAFWKPQAIRAGKARTIIHYISNPGVTTVTNMPSIDRPEYTASVEGPKTLKYYIDSTSGAELFGPSTFKITAFLENQDQFTKLRDCKFTLVPPTGIVLDSSETGLTKIIPEIPAKSDASVSWLVKADGSRTGILPYFVSVSASPMGSAVVKREIHVPAVSHKGMVSGWQQMSVPFNLTDTNPATALGLQPGSLRKIFRYDPNLPTTAPYYPYEEVTTLTPGEGYWLNLWNPSAATLTSGEFAPEQWGGTTGHEIPVHQGWNMIGNPYVYTVTMGELRFLTSLYGSLTYDEAVERRLVSRTLYWWNTTYGTWNWSVQRSAQISPWQGYWIKVISPVIQEVVISPESQIGASVGGEPPAGGGDDDGDGPPSFP